jgi:plastocyanin
MVIIRTLHRLVRHPIKHLFVLFFHAQLPKPAFLRKQIMKHLFTGMTALMTLYVSSMPATANPLLNQTPNIDTVGITPVGELDFPFNHGFSVSGSKVSNSPTFTLSTGITSRLEAAVLYSTNSNINNQFNELQPRLKYRLLGDDAPIALSIEGAYNSAANSFDGALLAARDLGPFTVLATGRGFSSGFGVGGPTAALGLGALWHLNPFLALSADLGGVVASLNRDAIAAQLINQGLVPAWSLGLNMVIPYSPHAVIFYLTNANTHTLEGLSRGDAPWRLGFDFLIPFEGLGRYAAVFQPAVQPSTAPVPVNAAPPAQSDMSAMAMSPPSAEVKPTASLKHPVAPPAHENSITISNFKFSPARLVISKGTTVRWSNHDPIAHSATADNGAWDTGLIPQGESASHTFKKSGTYNYHCIPHPFMKATVIVQ